MRAIKKARRLIEAQPESTASVVLSRLVVSLEAETPFDLASLYQLDYKTFELALQVLAEWRLDRYYSGKARLLGASVLVAHMAETPAQANAAAKAGTSVNTPSAP